MRDTGDSFRDLTRIARINDKMWAELFLWNKQNLISEIDQFDAALQEMRSALVADDRNRLEEMFRLSTQRRAAFDKKPVSYTHLDVYKRQGVHQEPAHASCAV